MYLNIVKVDADGHPTEINVKETEVEAQVVVDAVGGFFIDVGITVPEIEYVTADMVAKTIIQDTVAETAALTARALTVLRNQRDQLLADSDDRFIGDAPAGRGTQEWKDYRQALRDLPVNTPDPANPAWPVAPGV